MDGTGSNAHAIAGLPGSSFQPIWSPDGAHLAFLTYDPSWRPDITVKGTPRPPVLTVQILDVASGRVTALPIQVGSDINRPTWVSNDSLLVNALQR
jgi:hypothetical protein